MFTRTVKSKATNKSFPKSPVNSYMLNLIPSQSQHSASIQTETENKRAHGIATPFTIGANSNSTASKQQDTTLKLHSQQTFKIISKLKWPRVYLATV